MEGFDMKLSAPIPVLKRRARMQARNQTIPLNQALNQIAQQEGYSSWSLLSVKSTQLSAGLYDKLTSGDLVLLGARPGQGKTLMGLRVLIDAIAAGHKGYFFTLEYTTADVLARLRQMGADPEKVGSDFILDTSDQISAGYIADQTANARAGSVIVIDYLQLLDQNRNNPPLDDQVRVLAKHAASKGHVIIAISQIDRRYDMSAKPVPDMTDLRLPNPVDLNLFTKTCFLHAGEVVIS